MAWPSTDAVRPLTSRRMASRVAKALARCGSPVALARERMSWWLGETVELTSLSIPSSIQFIPAFKSSVQMFCQARAQTVYWHRSPAKRGGITQLSLSTALYCNCFDIKCWGGGRFGGSYTILYLGLHSYAIILYYMPVQSDLFFQSFSSKHQPFGLEALFALNCFLFPC